jgi:hypothetical protein
MSTRPGRHQGYSAIVVLLALAGLLSGTATAAAKSRPLVKITKAPLSRSHHPEAIFRFSSRATSTACRRDKLRYRRCRKQVKYSVRPGRHKFILRARKGKRTVYVSRYWTVLPRKGRKTPPPPPIAPADAATVARGPETAAADQRQLIWSDEFNGPALDLAAWRPFDGPGHANFGLRRPSAVAVDGVGNLVVTGSMQDGKIVAGGISAVTNFTYGRVVFRVRTEPDPTGTMSGVVLTWPKQQWSPEYTENDMYETGPRENNHSAFDSFIHFGPTTEWQKWTTHQFDPSQWHTIAMEWYPNLLEIYVDGLLGLSISDPYVIPDILHHVCIQLDARANRTLTRPVRMFVDYVRVYQ